MLLGHFDREAGGAGPALCESHLNGQTLLGLCPLPLALSSPEHLTGPCAGRLAPGRGGVSCSPHLHNYKERACSSCYLSLPYLATHTPEPWTLGNARVCLVSKEAPLGGVL